MSQDINFTVQFLPHSVTDKELMSAVGMVWVNNKLEGEKNNEGVLINSTSCILKYEFNLDDIVYEPGEYYVAITLCQNGREVYLENSFKVDDNGQYTFAADGMEKEY
jgi:hypothetical protein